MVLPAVHSQVNTLSNQKTKISVGLVESSNLSFRLSSSTSDLEWMKLGQDSIEKPLLGNSIAVLANLVLNERFQFNTGISLTKMGYQYCEGSLIGHTYFKEVYNLVEFPIHFLYKINLKKSFYFFTIGFSPGYAYNSFARYKLEGQLEEEYMRLNNKITNFQLATRLGLGMSIYLTHSWSLKSELFYNQELKSISTGPIKKYLFSSGLCFGLFKSF